MHLLLMWKKLRKEKQEMCLSGRWVEDGVDDEVWGGGGKPTAEYVLFTEEYRDWPCSWDTLFLLVSVASLIVFFIFWKQFNFC